MASSDIAVQRTLYLLSIVPSVPQRTMSRAEVESIADSRKQKMDAYSVATAIVSADGGLAELLGCDNSLVRIAALEALGEL